LVAHRGNAVRVIVDGFDHNARDVPRGYWDVQFVERLAGRQERW
jgi:hypothetical protein